MASWENPPCMSRCISYWKSDNFRASHVSFQVCTKNLGIKCCFNTPLEHTPKPLKRDFFHNWLRGVLKQPLKETVSKNSVPGTLPPKMNWQLERLKDGVGFGYMNYFTSSDPHHDMLGGGCQVRVVIENMMGRMENLRTLISGFLGLVILVRWALVTMFLSWTTQTGCRIHRTYVSLIGSGEGRHTTHLLKCVPLLSTSQTDWKQSSDVLSDISIGILSDISSDIFFWHIFWHSFWHIFWHSFWHLSDISFDILSDQSFDTLSDISSDISFHMLSDISSDILSDISKPKPNIHSFTQKAALQTLYLPHTTQQK